MSDLIINQIAEEVKSTRQLVELLTDDLKKKRKVNLFYQFVYVCAIFISVMVGHTEHSSISDLESAIMKAITMGQAADLDKENSYA